MPLLEGLDGSEKMSKSKGNFIGLTEPANEMFGKVMSISDALMWRWYPLLSQRPAAALAQLQQEAHQGRNPRDIKAELAHEIVTRFHSSQAAQAAADEFFARFKLGAIPTDMPHFTVASDATLTAVLKQTGLVSSTSEAIRAIEQGGVRIDSQKISDRSLRLAPGTCVMQVGKRRWARVTVA
jgi:tyrosyl-tRNA synthetase